MPSAPQVEPVGLQSDTGAPASADALPETPLGRAAFAVGSIGLVVATATDALAVLGRHAGLPLLGSIEIVQLAVVLVASAAMVGATIKRAHASVHIFTERMRPDAQATLARGVAVVAALLFLAVAIGSIWVAVDLWSGHERTELLGLPLRWLRLIWIGATLTVAALFMLQAAKATRSDP